jgi:hypothetical protein
MLSALALVLALVEWHRIEPIRVTFLSPTDTTLRQRICVLQEGSVKSFIDHIALCCVFFLTMGMPTDTDAIQFHNSTASSITEIYYFSCRV